MDAWKKFSRARDQLYHYKVGVRQHHEAIPVPHRTPQLVQLMDMVESLCNQAAAAFEAGQIMVMQIDVYEAVPLPGFEDFVDEMKKPRWDDEA